jgi:formylmethanofuran dehydrogenase subunit E-like metal-binding protein
MQYSFCCNSQVTCFRNHVDTGGMSSVYISTANICTRTRTFKLAECMNVTPFNDVVTFAHIANATTLGRRPNRILARGSRHGHLGVGIGMAEQYFE